MIRFLALALANLFIIFTPTQPTPTFIEDLSLINATNLVTASLAGYFIGNLIYNEILPKPKLENHPMCGMTTGGKVRRYY